MINSPNRERIATCETVLINVDLKLRKSTEYPDWARKKISYYKDACDEFILPREVGKRITLKK